MATFDPTAPEVWYPIPSLPGYEISSHFRVRSFHLRGRSVTGRYGGLTDRPRLLALLPLRAGYLTFHVRVSGRAGVIYLHHVIAELTLGPRPEGMMVLHRDDDKTNNHPSNLYYGTSPENWRDAVANGKATLGHDRKGAKLSDNEIRDLSRRGVMQKDIASRYGVTQSLVSRIVNGRRRLDGLGEI
jgi:hypothetical protein